MAALPNGGVLACKQHDSSGRTAFANLTGGTILTAYDANARAILPNGGLVACKQHDSSGRTAFANSAGGTQRTAYAGQFRQMP